jgi:hypothetical protein
MESMFEFIILPSDEQAQYIWDKGTYLLSRQLGRYNISLYHVDSFYAEIWYNKEDNVIYAITPFRDITRLDPYLKDMVLEIV